MNFSVLAIVAILATPSISTSPPLSKTEEFLCGWFTPAFHVEDRYSNPTRFKFNTKLSFIYDLNGKMPNDAIQSYSDESCSKVFSNYTEIAVSHNCSSYFYADHECEKLPISALLDVRRGDIFEGMDYYRCMKMV
ncbi:hypothetical protein P280DRAFT_482349 [Massarina eburnea CBS 473.64]|uniref:Uncharacterized protein n=1 Tax=Massarina eburnea CBS 473.64 TaxID=1395130 RepID=A0A6A6RV86_9PLEO|nr:hypothetical protein P280DRAFT_482349 [Massarina eburnea CBS 473.64]